MKSHIRVSVQNPFAKEGVPTRAQFTRWVAATLAGRLQQAELVIRVVDEPEGRTLNQTWRHKDYATNVLSFPAALPAGVPTSLLGDLVLCAPVVIREAAEQGKPAVAHWAHLTVHGTLHLLGLDHQTEAEASEMEALEIRVLGQLGFSDPYAPRDA